MLLRLASVVLAPCVSCLLEFPRRVLGHLKPDRRDGFARLRICDLDDRAPWLHEHGAGGLERPIQTEILVVHLDFRAYDEKTVKASTVGNELYKSLVRTRRSLNISPCIAQGDSHRLVIRLPLPFQHDDDIHHDAATLGSAENRCGKQMRSKQGQRRHAPQRRKDARSIRPRNQRGLPKGSAADYSPPGCATTYKAPKM